MRYRLGTAPAITVAAESRRVHRRHHRVPIRLLPARGDPAWAESLHAIYLRRVRRQRRRHAIDDGRVHDGADAGTGTVRFIAFGDSGVGSTAQRQLADRMTADTFNLALHAGDIAYGNSGGTGGGSYRQFDDWVFGVYGPWMRSRPLFPSIGNHENEIAAARPVSRRIRAPGTWRDVRLSRSRRALLQLRLRPRALRGARYRNGVSEPLARRQAQLAWLDADLAATPQPWKVVLLPPAAVQRGAAARVRSCCSRSLRAGFRGARRPAGHLGARARLRANSSLAQPPIGRAGGHLSRHRGRWRAAVSGIHRPVDCVFRLAPPLRARRGRRLRDVARGCRSRRQRVRSRRSGSLQPARSRSAGLARARHDSSGRLRRRRERRRVSGSGRGQQRRPGPGDRRGH